MTSSIFNSQLTQESSVLQQLLDASYETVGVLREGEWDRTFLVTSSNHKDYCVLREWQQMSCPDEIQQQTQARFTETVDVMTGLGQHPQIASMLDCGVTNDVLYLIREFVVGRSLSLAQSTDQLWTEGEVIHLLKDVLETLAYTHSRTGMHGNLHPDNLIQRQTDQKFVLTDFGSVVSHQLCQTPDQPVTDGADQPNKLGYLPAEQLSGKRHPSHDLYSLGVIAIEQLTHCKPWQLPTQSDTGELVWRDRVQISDALTEVLNRMTKARIGDRFSSAREALCALEEMIVPAVVVPAALRPQPAPLIHRKVAGASLILTSLIAAGGYNLLVHPDANEWFDRGRSTLQRAEQTYQQGDLPAAIALAESVAPESSAYESAQTAIDRWQQEWDRTTANFQLIEAAAAEQRWQDVLQTAQEIPIHEFWQAQIAPFVKQAQTESEHQGEQLLQEAYNHAYQKDFTAALAALRQIAPTTAAYAGVPDKLAEYQEKQGIRAKFLLQQAYKAANERNFSQAIVHLRQISPETPSFAIAEQKIAEYTEKQQIRASYLLQRAYNQAIARDFAGAIEYLQQIPADVPAYDVAQQKILEYRAKQ